MNKSQGRITGMIIVGEAVGKYPSPGHNRKPIEHPAGLIFQTPFDEQPRHAEYDKVDKAKGLNISIIATARKDEEALFLLRLLGMRFRRG